MKYYAGLDLGGTFVKGGIVDETGAIVRADKIPTGKDRRTAKSPPTWRGSCERSPADANVSMSDVAAVGIGSPGTIDSKTASSITATTLPGTTFRCARRSKKISGSARL